MNQKERNRRHYEDAKKAYDALMKFYPLTTDDLDGEEWKTAPYCSDYLLSNYGRVKSLKYKSPRILTPVLGNVYLQVGLYKDDKCKLFQIHRLVAAAFIPNPEGKREVNHIDTHKLNNYVGNLEWVSSAENKKHAVANDLIKSGEDSYQAKLTDEQVLYIRNNPDGLNLEQLAEKFGVIFQTISLIQLGKTFKNAGGTIREPKIKKISDEIRDAVLARYKKGVRGCGKRSLAKEFGIAETSVHHIVHSDE